MIILYRESSGSGLENLKLFYRLKTRGRKFVDISERPGHSRIGIYRILSKSDNLKRNSVLDDQTKQLNDKPEKI